MAIRSTRQYAEILTNGSGKARVSRQYAEVLANGTGKARVSRQYVEVLSSVPTGSEVIAACAESFTLTEFVVVDHCRTVFDSFTLSEGASAEVGYGVTDVLSMTETVQLNFSLGRPQTEALSLVEEAKGNFIRRVRAADALTLVEVVAGFGVKPITETLTFSEQVSLTRVFGITDTLVLSDTIALSVEHHRAAADTLALVEMAAEYFDTAADTLALTESATYTRSFRVRAIDTLSPADTAVGQRTRSETTDALALSEEATVTVFNGNVSALDTLTLSEVVRVFGRAWDTSVTDALQYAFEDYDEATGQTYTVFEGLQDVATVIVVRQPRGAADFLSSLGEQAAAVVVRADALPAGSSDTFALVDQAWANIAPTVTETLAFTEVAYVTATKTAADALELTDTASTLVVRVVSAADTLVVTDAILFELPFAGVEHQYHPFVGSGSMPTAITGMTGEPGFTLCYPPAGPFTDTLTLRNPRFGNRDRVQTNRITRETRGGTLIVFADAMWPKVQTQIYQFEALSWEQANGLFTFLDGHLGQEIGVLDHHGRYYRGIVVTAEDPIAHDGKRGFSVGFEIEAELASYPA